MVFVLYVAKVLALSPRLDIPRSAAAADHDIHERVGMWYPD